MTGVDPVVGSPFGDRGPSPEETSPQDTSPAGETTAGGAVFERLGRLGVDLVLVNSGTDFPPIIEGLAEAEHTAADDPGPGHPEGGPVPVRLPRTVLVGHEHVAMGMAHGAYLATGRPQAVMLHTNVGLANGATGAINAATDQVPMLVLSGRTPTVEAGRFGARTVPIGWGQEMRDQSALVREACKWDYELRFPEQVPSLLDRAHAIASTIPRGPVYLSLPREVLCQPCPRDELARPPSQGPVVVGPDPAALGRLAELLAEADTPLIVAQRGAGTAEGFDALARLAERWAVPVCQWWAVATAISSRHPMSVGADPGPWLSAADLVVVVDSLAPWSPDVHRPPVDCPIVHLGPDPLQSRVPVRGFRSDLAVAAEVGPALVALEAELARIADDRPSVRDRAAVVERRARITAHSTARRAALVEASAADGEPSSVPGAMTKAYVAACVGRVVNQHQRRGGRVTVLSELGCPLDHLDLTTHDSYRQEPHSGGLGWSLPCALGLKLADPDRLVVATLGDGSYIFGNPVACHQVAEAVGIPVLTVVLNNAGYGAVRHSVTDLYPTGHAAKEAAGDGDIPLTSLSPSPDFALVASASRAHAETVSSGPELPAALERAVRSVVEDGRQALVDVRIVP